MCNAGPQGREEPSAGTVVHDTSCPGRMKLSPEVKCPELADQRLSSLIASDLIVDGRSSVESTTGAVARD